MKTAHLKKEHRDRIENLIKVLEDVLKYDDLNNPNPSHLVNYIPCVYQFASKFWCTHPREFVKNYDDVCKRDYTTFDKLFPWE